MLTSSNVVVYRTLITENIQLILIIFHRSRKCTCMDNNIGVLETKLEQILQIKYHRDAVHVHILPFLQTKQTKKTVDLMFFLPFFKIYFYFKPIICTIMYDQY